ncbi:glucose-6-phosphate dehydrogenase (NADP(+)) [Candidatus Micrarchaeota archaeon]|nr:glucose-6-phosphate dehydrogenase (NADP(+)) [Candidatus Micrarchaeota archaeon]
MAKKTLVIFGITGDLASRKLLPALWNGFLNGRFKDLSIWGVGRKPWGNAGLHKNAREVCEPKDEKAWQAFEKKLEFFRVDVEDEKEFNGFCEKLDGRSDLLFMLATLPSLYEKISARLGKLENKGYRRLMIEKPFGHDLKSARALHAELAKDFGEEVYPMDHYLGKSAVRNIVVLRFSNPLFEPVWNNQYIQSVQIIQTEQQGVGHRAAFYDETGALKDMVQSHLVQMLARVAMECPKKWVPAEVAKEKAIVLEALRPSDDIVFGQYAGYEKEVGHASNTETFVALKAFIDTPRWKGVPFYLLAGKNLESRFAQIVITFKPMHYNVPALPSTLTITLQPEEKFILKVNLKRAGESELEPFKMEYCESCEIRPRSPQAYEVLFEEALEGKKTFFTWWPEIEAAWEFVEAVQKKAKGKKPLTYKPGSPIPKAAEKIVDWKEYGE